MKKYPYKRKINYRRYIAFWIRHIFNRIRHYSFRLTHRIAHTLSFIVGRYDYNKCPMRKNQSYIDFSKEHGRYGEFQLWRIAKRHLGKDARWLSNLYLPKKDGTTCEIDLVAISQKGIFVFESKNYTGWIYGNDEKPYWYEMVRKDIKLPAQKYTFFNPIMQNKMHCNCIKDILTDEKDNIRSYVVFGNGCKLKKIELHSTQTIVCKLSNLSRYLKREPRRVISPEKIHELYACLQKYTDIGYSEKQKHIAQVQNKHKNSSLQN